MPPSTSLDATNAVATPGDRAAAAQRPDVLDGLLASSARRRRRHRQSLERQQPGADHGAAGASRTSATQSQRRDRAPSCASRSAGRIPAPRCQIGLPNAFGFGGFGGQPIQVQVQGPDPATSTQLADAGRAGGARRCRARSTFAAATTTSRRRCAPRSTGRRAADLGVTARRRRHGAAHGARRLHVERQPVPPDRPGARSTSGS